MKRENAIGKMVPPDSLDTGLPQTFNLLKKKKSKSSIYKVKYSKAKLYELGL